MSTRTAVLLALASIVSPAFSEAAFNWSLLDGEWAESAEHQFGCRSENLHHKFIVSADRKQLTFKLDRKWKIGTGQEVEQYAAMVLRSSPNVLVIQYGPELPGLSEEMREWELRFIGPGTYMVCPTGSNKEPNFAHWRDTYWVQAEDGGRELLMHYSKFTGQFVMHCHKLIHEDEGMMELLEICAPGDQSCLCQGTDAGGKCISSADCKPTDKRCQFAKAATAAYPLPPAPDPMLCGK